jgi:molybdopterin-guanine dinucleotide biosynthesis protein A
VKNHVRQHAIFASHKNLFGLPCLIPRDSLPIITRQIANSQFSLQSLARALKAKPVTPSRNPARQLLNLNTPADFGSMRFRRGLKALKY